VSLDLAIAVVGGTILLPGLFSTPLKRVGLSIPVVALALGVALGPEALGVVDAEEIAGEHRLLEELARFTLAFSLVATGLQFTRDDLRVNAARGGLLLVVGMTGMWLMTSLGAWLLLDLPVGLSLLLGAIVTPTDPVVAATIVTGRLAEANLPRWLRRTLQLEAGANDGLTLLFVLVPALLLTEPGLGLAGAVGDAVWRVALAAGLGLVLGMAAGRLTDLVTDRQEVGESFFFAVTIGLALLTLGLVHGLGASGVLASFVAGVAFSLAVGEQEAVQLESIQAGLERSLITAVFLLFGVLLPWDAWMALGWPALAFVAWVLVLRRPPAVALALAPTGTPRRGVVFAAWFGPLGVAAIYYATFSERYGFAEYERILGAATLAIAVSVVVHTLTAMPGVRRYAGRRARTTLLHPFTPGIDERP
jgi:sodium/hydrogen antiporter